MLRDAAKSRRRYAMRFGGRFRPRGSKERADTWVAAVITTGAKFKEREKIAGVLATATAPRAAHICAQLLLA